MQLSINKFFVYGTLRPDIKAPWSDIVHKNPMFKIKSSKSSLCYSKLFIHKRINYPICIYDTINLISENKTIGYILETDNIKETLSIFDEIEEYPELYDRKIVDCHNLETQKTEQAYFYTLNANILNFEDLIDININDFSLIKNEY